MRLHRGVEANERSCSLRGGKRYCACSPTVFARKYVRMKHRWTMWTARAILVGVVLLQIGGSEGFVELGRAADTAKPYGIERRLALTTSTVVGSPDPPLPFRSRRAYPQLNLDYP